MSTKLAVQVDTFEGASLSTYVFQGRECWIAADVGRVLGYESDGLLRVLRKNWAEEMIDGRDFKVLAGEGLREFLAGTSFDPDQRSGSKTRRLMVLYESGLHLVCIKTDKPLGKKLRRFLVEEVLPKLRRGALTGPTVSVEQVREILREEFALLRQLLLSLTESIHMMWEGEIRRGKSLHELMEMIEKQNHSKTRAAKRKTRS